MASYVSCALDISTFEIAGKKKKKLSVLMSVLALTAGSLMAEILISLFIASSLPFRVPARAWLLVSWLQYLDVCGWHRYD